MNVTNPPRPSTLHPDLERALQSLRATRGFDARLCIEGKAEMLNGYLADHGLQSVVVAVSGGVDSALVLGLAAHAAERPGSPIRRIVAALLPVLTDGAVTGQAEATARGIEVCRAFGVQPLTLDVTATHQAIKQIADQAMGVTGQDWASGQLAAYARTPVLYYLTSLLSEQNTPGVILGTTNRDEGAYLGYVGKASDGMVDVQLIADLHKSEVYACAEQIGVPDSVLDAVPTGDMYDGRTDEEVFGTSYDFVELYLNMLAVGAGSWLGADRVAALHESWSEPARAQYRQLATRLEKLHRHNLHKYLGRSPAVHLNLYPSAVPGGWDR